MSDLHDIYAAMAAVFAGIASVGVAYAKPPEVSPPDANLPAVVPSLPSGELDWGVSHDSRDHTMVWSVLVARGQVLADAFDQVIPVVEDIFTAFQTNQRLGLSFVYSCLPKTYDIGGMQFHDEAFIGAEITFTVKQKRAVSFR